MMMKSRTRDGKWYKQTSTGCFCMCFSTCCNVTRMNKLLNTLDRCPDGRHALCSAQNVEPGCGEAVEQAVDKPPVRENLGKVGIINSAS